MSAPIAIAATRMARRLTTPFGRGADTLALSLSPIDANNAAVATYDFTDHVARYDSQPEPRYVLTATQDIPSATTVTVSFAEPGASATTVDVPVPAGTVAGTSFVLPAPVTATARLSELHQPDGPPDQLWTVTALLGTMAKLLWVLGAERDLLRQHLAKTVAQRHLPDAVGLSLDLIGFDLGVPRFPPLPYGFDAGTVGLYHLDDVAGATPAVADVTAAYPGRTGHPGTLNGSVQVGVTGRYGQAMAFRAATTFVQIASSTDFDIAGTASATMECFVRPDPGATDGPVLSRQAATGAGWSVQIGQFGRGLALNVRFTVSDGSKTIDVFADTSLPTDTFTHVAAVLDRSAGVAALFLNGVFRASTPLGTFGAIANSTGVSIGPVTGGFRGIVDEVRISSVARSDFAPALGEADEHYRRRLELFRRWTLPTPANLTAILNELAGPISGHDNALIVDDTNAILVRGTRLVRIVPVSLDAGQTIAATGERGVTEAATVGTSADEDTFDPVFLFRYNRTDVDFGTPPTGSGADPQLVQVSLAGPLDRLVGLAAAEPGPAGRLLIAAAFDPQASDLRITGRAVLLGHSTITSGRLAALAHRAGFDFVNYRTDGSVYAANALGDYFAIDITPTQAGPTDLDVGSPAVALSLRPAPPAGAVLNWLTVPNGPAAGVFTTTGTTTTLLATAPGELIVKLDLTHNGHTVPATRALRVGLLALPDQQSITDDGTLGVAFTDTDAFFDARFLAQHTDSRVNYGTDPNTHLMQPAVAEAMNFLLDELTRRSASGQLTIVSGFQPTGDPISSQGRTLTIQHATVAPDALGAIAHAVGFGHVKHNGATVIVTQAPGELVVVHGPTDSGLVLELDEGATLTLSVQPALTTGGTGSAEVRLSWASGVFDVAHATLGIPTQPTTTLLGDSAGLAWVQASYLLGDLPVPYTFRVGLQPAFDVPATVITKDQYDLILNVLNTLHPVGIEVNTQSIRDHTIEVSGNLAAANPDFTYPKFRVRSVLPPLRRDDTSG